MQFINPYVKWVLFSFCFFSFSMNVHAETAQSVTFEERLKSLSPTQIQELQKKSEEYQQQMSKDFKAISQDSMDLQKENAMLRLDIARLNRDRDQAPTTLDKDLVQSKADALKAEAMGVDEKRMGNMEEIRRLRDDHRIFVEQMVNAMYEENQKSQGRT